MIYWNGSFCISMKIITYSPQMTEGVTCSTENAIDTIPACQVLDWLYISMFGRYCNDGLVKVSKMWLTYTCLIQPFTLNRLGD